ncbi:MAG TPA: hypothetical protein VEF04_11215 [Blastocatellia bacterium]|nr:hypothetical protein [Blastocatellia bacterium]
MQRHWMNAIQAIFVWLLLSSACLAQAELRVIATSRLDTFERELNEHAQQGFRLHQLFEATTIFSNTAALFRDPQNQPQRYEYKLLRGLQATTMQKELDAATAQGFEVRGVCAIGKLYVGTDISFLLERPAGHTTPRVQYQIVTQATGREEELRAALQSALAQGFEPLRMLRSFDQGLGLLIGRNKSVDILLLAKSLEATNTPTKQDLEYQIISTHRLGTLEKELNQYAQQGYRIQLSARGRVVLLARNKGQSNALAEYKLIRLKSEEKSEMELRRFVAQGFRYRAGFIGEAGAHLILEHQLQPPTPKPTQITYKIIKIPFSKKSELRMEQAAAQELASGFRFVAIIAVDKMLLVLESK